VKLCNIIFEGSIDFKNTTFCSDVCFTGAIFRKHAKFIGSRFNGNAGFNGTKFGGVSFERSIFSFYAVWGYANFKQTVDFEGAKFQGDFVSFGEADFVLPKSEEDACRRAKSVMAKAGRRYWEEHFFYREMVAKRKQNSLLNNLHRKHNTLKALKAEPRTFVERIKDLVKPFKDFIMYDFAEYILFQRIFGYGVRPWNVIRCWVLFVIFIFPLFYWMADGMNVGLLDRYIGDSFIIAVAPGYISTIINSTARHTLPYHFVAYAELLMGAFLWACLIATFIKRYMR